MIFLPRTWIEYLHIGIFVSLWEFGYTWSMWVSNPGIFFCTSVLSRPPWLGFMTGNTAKNAAYLCIPEMHIRSFHSITIWCILASVLTVYVCGMVYVSYLTSFIDDFEASWGIFILFLREYALIKWDCTSCKISFWHETRLHFCYYC